jgi:hypothetical protein
LSRRDREGQHRERPRRNRRHQRVQRDAGEEVRDGGNQQVIEHRQPAREESRAATDALGDVREDRAGVRHDRRHLRVGPGGERHRDRREQVDERHRAIRARVEDTKEPTGAIGPMNNRP